MKAECREVIGRARKPCGEFANEVSDTKTGVIFKCPKGHTFNVSFVDISHVRHGEPVPRNIKVPAARALPPEPPTGPVSEEFSDEDGRTPAFWTFFNSEDGRKFWADIQRDALAELAAGGKRFSPRTFLAHYRDTQKMRVNNVFSPWFADMLVTEHPGLLDIVERRKRKKKGTVVA